jgi:hypothetical protein
MHVEMKPEQWQALMDILVNAPAPLRVTQPIVQTIVEQLNAQQQAAQQPINGKGEEAAKVN